MLTPRSFDLAFPSRRRIQNIKWNAMHDVKNE
jgi:hypothetical protein